MAGRPARNRKPPHRRRGSQPRPGPGNPLFRFGRRADSGLCGRQGAPRQGAAAAGAPLVRRMVRTAERPGRGVCPPRLGMAAPGQGQGRHKGRPQPATDRPSPPPPPQGHRRGRSAGTPGGPQRRNPSSERGPLPATLATASDTRPACEGAHGVSEPLRAITDRGAPMAGEKKQTAARGNVLPGPQGPEVGAKDDPAPRQAITLQGRPWPRPQTHCQPAMGRTG